MPDVATQVTDSDNVHMSLAAGAREVPLPVVLRYMPRTSIASASHRLRMVDVGKLLRTSNGSAVTISVPAASSVAFPADAHVHIVQEGTGQVTFVAEAGVTISTPETLKIAKQYGMATLLKLDTDSWLLVGNLEAA